jgi:EAL domain-containing protein (putative c-di-GMP-specific phosphodiesterase class I)
VASFVPFGRAGFFGAEAADPPASRGTVYFVDDLADRFHFLTPAFAQAGFRIVLAASASEFKQAFNIGNAVAVFVDVHMGEDDATDVFDILRAWSYKSSLYLVSGDSGGMNSARKYAEDIGLSVKEQISKPFTGKQLVERLCRDAGAVAELLEQIDISEATDKGWIYPVFQPKLDLASDTIRSAELLTRVAHPDFGVISPQAFVGRLKPPQAHQLLMTNLSHFTRDFRYNPRLGNDFRININADLQSLVTSYDEISALARTYPEYYRNLVFEITEEMLANLSSSGVKTLCKYSIQGVKFSIDDFGIGASSFSRLSRLPMAEVKIDMSIVRNCASTRTKGVMVKSIINMAQDIGLRVVAEGVESVEELEFLRAAGCDDVQGYLVGRPMRLDKFRAFVARYNKSHTSAATADGSPLALLP